MHILRWGEHHVEVGQLVMRYTPGQLRGAVGLSKEALRHWKRVLPGSPHGQSHAPTYSPGDVLAFAVLRRLTEVCGVRVGLLRAVSRSVFVVCNETPWEVLAKRTIVVDLERQECATVPQAGPLTGDSAVVVCPMAPVIAMLREALVGASPLSMGPEAPGDAGSTGVTADRRA